MSKRVRIYTAEDVATRKTQSSCWLSRQGKVYNVTKFLTDHPGGDDIILKYAGKDVDGVMAGKEGESHDHSESAYEMLAEYQIGRLGTEETLLSEDWDAPDDFHPEETDSAADFSKNQFLDLDKPLFRQVYEANFSKSYYLQQIHQPRHRNESARFFSSDILEAFTRTVWWVVPMFWGPIMSYLFCRSVTAVCFFAGNIIWTILEYTLHRFLFHIDDLLPDHPTMILLHFTMHGVHHYLPMDRLRLVMPPILFGTLQAPFTALAHKLFPAAVANGIISGAFTFYILYDCMHYALHHTQLPAYLREQKRYHLAHHYKNFELGFGVTSKFWDYVFGTQLQLRPL
ncbi:fatty acid-2 hydroxylase [Mycena galopus ATCC 62051]|nr:fatty acid-2 hydroxylase [Mycena galopus ATCC 62051]